MAIVSVSQIVGSSAEQDDEYVYTYRKVYQVISDSRKDDEHTILSLAQIPSQYSLHPVNTVARCVNRRASMVSESQGFVWIVEVTYSTKFKDTAENPLQRPVLFDFGFAKHSVPYSVDSDGTEVKNSAGAPYDPLPLKDVSRLHFTATKNVLYYDVAMAEAYQDVINSVAWAGLPARTVKCNNIRGRGPIFENSYTYYEAVFEFEFRRDGWNDVLADVGYWYKVGTARVLFDDGRGQQLPNPMPLDGAGGELTSGAWKYNTFKPYEAKPFAPLGLI